MSVATSIAKLTRPRLHQALPRERLFALLDEHRRRPAIWISAPPGAGKTTLVTSYLEARRLAGIWYQVDRGDADPAAFFHYFAQAVGYASSADQPLLPQLQPEHMADLPGFARRFFREACGALATPTVVVLDNYQEVPAESPFHAVVVTAIEQMPAGITLVVISRTGPAAQEAARLLVNGAIARIDAEALRLSPDETAALAAAGDDLDADTLATLHSRANGWAVGVVLMADHLRRTGSLDYLDASEPVETVFAYFGAEIFQRASFEMRLFLVRTAFLPQITVAMAEALSGNAEAAALLDRLYRQHWFTDRRSGAQVSYQYHALFRQFLAARAATLLTAQELLATKRHAAALLAANDQIEPAVALLAEIGDWAALTALVVAQAQSLTTQGRYTTLSDWIGRAPEAVIAQTPWLLFWRGRARLPFDPVGSLPDFERAFALFRDQRDAAGVFSAWGSIANAIVWDISGDQRRLDPLLATLDELLAEHPGFTHPQIDWLVAYTAMCCLYLREPQHPHLDEWRARALELARRNDDITSRLPTVHMALLVNLMRGDHARAAVEMVDYPQIGEANLLEAQTALLYFGRAYFEARTGDFAACLATVDEAIAASDASGIHAWDHQVLAQGVTSSIALGALERAGQLLARLATDPRSRAGHSGSNYHLIAAWYEFIQGARERALVHADTAVKCADMVGAVYLSGVSRLGLAQVLDGLGHKAAARETLVAALDIAQTIGGKSLAYMCRLVAADFAHGDGDLAAGDAALAAALAQGRDERYISYVWWRDDLMARLCARALELGVEIDYVQHIINARGLRAPARDIESWPWPVRIYTLGRFVVVVDGKPVSFARKAQKSPLALLQALIALGGRDVDEVRVAQAMTEDDGGDSLKTLGMTLLRLRKLLGRPEAVTLSGGKLTLDAAHCWVDAWAFEDKLADLNRPTQCPRALDQALRLYAAPFLHLEPERPWMLPARARLHDRFLRALQRQGQWLEAAGDWSAAIAWYQRGLEADPASEELYRRLMRCHEQCGEPAAAIKVYQRCRSMLSMLLGIAPSAETEALRKRLIDST